MKLIFIASALTLSLVSLTTFARDDDNHGHGAGVKQHTGQAAGLGKPGVAGKASQTITVDMNDTMRFTPATISIKRGQTVKFIVTNSGKIKHEIVLGSITELRAHAAMMAKFPKMEHADSNQVSLDPGKTGELTWQFDKAGTFDFACLQPGHFEAGMRGKIIVE